MLASGNRIDGFEVLDVIFSGTRSHMYLVKDSESGQRFVLKAPSGNFAEDAVYLDGFIREEWVGQRIDHPNVMKTYRPPREKRFLYYLGEHIEGMNLREWLQDNPKPPSTRCATSCARRSPACAPSSAPTWCTRTSSPRTS